MNKRTIGVTVGLNRAKVLNELPLTQSDRNSHSFYISFGDEVELKDYLLFVFYKLPESAPVRTIVDKYDLDPTLRTLNVTLPAKALEKTGKLFVEFALKHKTEDFYLTVSEKLKLEITGTINGSIVEAIPGDNIQLHIDQQIEKIETLLEQIHKEVEEFDNNVITKTGTFNENANNKTIEFNNNATVKTNSFDENAKNKVTEFDGNVTNKTNSFNENAKTKTNNFNDNVQAKTTEFDRHSSEIVTQAYQNIQKQAGISANSAAIEANKLVVAQQNSSVQVVRGEGDKQIVAVQTAGTTSKGEVEQTGTTAINNINTTKNQAIDSINTSKNSAIQALNDEKIKQVKAVTDQGDLTKQGVVEEGNKVVTSNKSELDTYVNTTSKPHIDSYVTQKEGEIKGATFTPTVDEKGNISWKNDKNLENPITKNIKGPKGDPGNFIFKVENGHLILYTVDNGKAPTFKLENGHLIMEII